MVKEKENGILVCHRKTANNDNNAPSIAISQWKRKPGLKKIMKTSIIEVDIKISAGRIISITLVILSINMPQTLNLM
ncbi:MAG: hypothetical protein ABIJ65_11495 [Chloroflexota bacterium]